MAKRHSYRGISKMGKKDLARRFCKKGMKNGALPASWRQHGLTSCVNYVMRYTTHEQLVGLVNLNRSKKALRKRPGI